MSVLTPTRLPTALVLAAALACLASQVPRAAGRQDLSAAGKDTYDQIKAFALTGGTASVTNLTLKRDRVEMTFTGTFHFAAPTGGRVTGAVFVGDGTVRADVPPSDFERDNVRRMIGADLVESDFKTVVLRWSDETFDLIAGARRDGGTAPAPARQLAAEFDARFTRETGANLPARLATSLLNGETPGVFAAQFDGGRRGRFTYLLDHQGRIPVANFQLNGGEKGIIFDYQPALLTNDVWMAFYSTQDYEKRTVQYSDANDLIDISHYRLNLDLREFRRRIGLVAHIEMQARAANIRAMPFKVGESLPLSRDMRLKNQLRVKEVRLGDQGLSWVQEDWEGGFTVFLPQPAQRDQPLILNVVLDGDFMHGGDIVPECYYPLDNVSWLPRHGYLDRATLDMTFQHRRLDHIVSIGTRISEQPDSQDRDAAVTRYRMTHPVALAVFALGPFQRKTQQVAWESGGAPIPLEFNSVPSRVAAIKHEFILAELDNSVRYFAAMFGRYPYETFGAAFHPYPFGQGFPTLLMIPPTDRENKYTHAFIAHETAHQWWGNIVAWRSYRDQWLSEGFAEYSGLLYAGKRDREGAKAAADLVRELRDSLRNPPRTSTGLGKGRLNDIGPIVLGLRLNTSKSLGAYQALIYNKGALVLRMLHFLMSNPASLDDSAFVAMMKDFVERHRNGAATTDDFRTVANEHFARTPIAQKFGLKDLDWFFRQWVYGTGLPAYQLEYEVKTQPGGTFVSGVVKQDNVDGDWSMVLPVVFSFEGGQEGRTTVRASGPTTAFEFKLPAAPRKVELDPASWVLSEKTTSRAK